MKLKLLGLLVLAGGSLLAQGRWSVSIGIGTPYYAPPPPPPPVYYMPPCPGPDYAWIPGYYYPRGLRFEWRSGYWSRRPYAGAYWVQPRYYDNRYYQGYWGGRGRDRDWDRGDERWERHDNGRHRGWYKSHHDD